MQNEIMKNYDPLQPVFSVHIPKSAGSSFSMVLQNWFGDNFLRHYPIERNNTLPGKHILKPGICIHGHFNNRRGTGVFDYYPMANQLITVIRDPFEIHVSNYFYALKKAKENDGHVYHDGKLISIIENNWSLKDYLKHENRSYIMNFFPSEITMENYKGILEKRYLFIGLAEKLQLSVDRLSKIMGFESVRVPNVNQSERQETIPPDAKERFVENNPLEMAVYNHIESRFVP